ncbi:MAG: hypothetical protein A2075_16315 [Geobacteraceae bacterium GWC2_58_44]|nr:MAG: hypothetical protein A2075_16315 [Geobacteraceae bacterium GWC2_58_44]HBG05956.1 hypothetical protein [Geobacter sp.]
MSELGNEESMSELGNEESMSELGNEETRKRGNSRSLGTRKIAGAWGREKAGSRKKRRFGLP